jgi:hypothetical protein
MAELLTAIDLDADLVERTAKAIGRARLLTDYPGDPMISADGYALYWRQVHASYRLALRQQAIAVLRASRLLERVAELERAIERANTDLEAYDHTACGDALARHDARQHLSKVHDKQIV